MGDKYLKKIFIKKPLYKEFYVNLQTIRVYKDLIISTIVDYVGYNRGGRYICLPILFPLGLSV